MAKKKDLPPVGSTVYVVAEHFWKLTNEEYPYGRNVREYCVYEGTIRSYNLGHFTDVYVKVTPPDEPLKLFRERLEDGGHIFMSPKDAARYAKERTEKDEAFWLGIVGEPDYPMRRTWAKYLEGN